jgi:hypothetical protein
MNMIRKFMAWLFPAPDSTFEKIMYTFAIIMSALLFGSFGLLGIFLIIELFDIPDLASLGYTVWTGTFVGALAFIGIQAYGIYRLAKFGLFIWKKPFTVLQAL